MDMTKKKKEILVVVLIVVLVLAALIGLTFLRKELVWRDLINVKSDLEMSADNRKIYGELKEKLKENRNDYNLLFKLARLKQDMTDYDGAEDLYLKLLKIKPDDVVVLNNLGSLYFDIGRYEDSEKFYLRIINTTPKWVNAYRRLLMIYQFHLKDKQAAMEPLLLKALEEAPELKIDMVSMLIRYYDDVVNNKEKAIEYLKKLLEINPKDSVAKQRLQELQKK